MIYCILGKSKHTVIESKLFDFHPCSSSILSEIVHYTQSTELTCLHVLQAPNRLYMNFLGDWDSTLYRHQAVGGFGTKTKHQHLLYLAFHSTTSDTILHNQLKLFRRSQIFTSNDYPIINIITFNNNTPLPS